MAWDGRRRGVTVGIIPTNLVGLERVVTPTPKCCVFPCADSQFRSTRATKGVETGENAIKCAIMAGCRFLQLHTHTAEREREREREKRGGGIR
jgi:hypothetical protein